MHPSRTSVTAEEDQAAARGEPEISETATHRRVFLIGVAGALAVLLLLALTGLWEAGGALGAFLAVMLVGGFRWLRAARRLRRQRSRR